MKFCGVRHTQLAVVQPWPEGKVPHYAGALGGVYQMPARRAAEIWMEAGSGLEVLDVTIRPTISAAVHEFKERLHGDGQPFDGMGGIVAHATVGPPGWIHYDVEEEWDPEGSATGVRFLSVALHELGHTWGIGHSPDEDSIMFPNYSGRHELGTWDVEQLWALYPEDPSTIPPTPATFWGRRENTTVDGRTVVIGTPITAAAHGAPEVAIAEAEWADDVWALRWPMRFGKDVLFRVDGIQVEADFPAISGNLMELELAAGSDDDEEEPAEYRLLIEGELRLKRV